MGDGFRLRSTHPTKLSSAPRHSPCSLPRKRERGKVHLRVLAARFARGFAIRSRPSIRRAQGMPGAGWHPRSRVQCAQTSAHTSIQVQPEQPGIPCAMGLRLIPCSPWRRIPLASIAGGLKALAKPGWISQNLRRLDTSHGCQNHTALPSVTFAVRRRAAFAHEQAHPAKTSCAPGVPRPPLPAPNVRDDRDTPLLWARDGGSCRSDLGRTRSGIFLCGGLDRF
ncbi:MAG: hypothetical protein QOD83_4896 [Solirubrobacteraceae bacterium]|jgi:hypothetical protein|nr:hypothetical protein [Solirubrobacteraceae bacterium]